ncbi:glycosyltransferase family 4 protein [Reinekea sp.]|uniref:glycosyltransferase family 4 protein n=1 Tax=Reinekea sp. TaxID=1970455 RepID=UPI0039894134
MNILLINHYAGHPKLGMEFRPFYIAREWVKQGHSVTILAADYSHLRYCQPNGHGRRSEIIDGIQYVWLPTIKYQGNGFARLLNISQFLLSGCSYLRKKKGEYDHVIASSTYPLDILLAKYVSKGSRVTFELHDIWPMTLYTVGKLPRWHPFVMLMKVGERLSYWLSDKVVSMLSNAYDHVKLYGVKPENYCYIPNGVDSNAQFKFKDSLSDNATATLNAITELKRNYDLVAGYVGGHAISNHLDTLVATAEVSPEVAFVFVGSGNEKEKLKTSARNFKNVVFLDSIEKEEVAPVLKGMDILLISWADEEIYKYGTGANKIFDYLLSGKPIIQAINSPNNPVQLAEAGLTVPPGDFQAIAKAVVTLKDKKLRDAMGQRGIQYVNENHQYCELSLRFIDFINS